MFYMVAAGLAVMAVVLLIAKKFEWTLVEELDSIKGLWKFWVVRLQALCGSITAILFFDPNVMLSVFGFVPPHILKSLPPGVVFTFQIIFGVLFLFNVMSIVARGVAQPKIKPKDNSDADKPT